MKATSQSSGYDELKKTIKILKRKRGEIDEELRMTRKKLKATPEYKADKAKRIQKARDDELKDLLDWFRENVKKDKNKQAEIDWLVSNECQAISHLCSNITFGQFDEPGDFGASWAYGMAVYGFRSGAADAKLDLIVAKDTIYNDMTSGEDATLYRDSNESDKCPDLYSRLQHSGPDWRDAYKDCDAKWHLGIFLLRHWSELEDAGDYFK